MRKSEEERICNCGLMDAAGGCQCLNHPRGKSHQILVDTLRNPLMTVSHGVQDCPVKSALIRGDLVEPIAPQEANRLSLLVFDLLREDLISAEEYQKLIANQGTFFGPALLRLIADLADNHLRKNSPKKYLQKESRTIGMEAAKRVITSLTDYCQPGIFQNHGSNPFWLTAESSNTGGNKIVATVDPEFAELTGTRQMNIFTRLRDKEISTFFRRTRKEMHNKKKTGDSAFAKRNPHESSLIVVNGDAIEEEILARFGIHLVANTCAIHLPQDSMGAFDIADQLLQQLPTPVQNYMLGIINNLPEDDNFVIQEINEIMAISAGFNGGPNPKTYKQIEIDPQATRLFYLMLDVLDEVATPIVGKRPLFAPTPVQSQY